MESPTPQSTTGTDHVTTSSKLPDAGGRDKELAPVSSAFRQKKKKIFCIFSFFWTLNSFRDCLYTTCFVRLDASGLLVLSACSLRF